MKITEKIYSVTKKYPYEERYGLAAQMRGSSVSIPSNIAEGFMRNHLKEYTQFLYIALGSCAELETQLIIAKGQNYSTGEASNILQEEINCESRMLMALIKNLNKSNTQHL